MTVSERPANAATVFGQYLEALAHLEQSAEIIVVLDGEYPGLKEEMQKTYTSDCSVGFHLIELGKWFGEAAALKAAFDIAVGDTVLTLPPYQQVDPNGLPDLLSALEDADVSIAVRSPRVDGSWNRAQARAFYWAIRVFAKANYEDLGCGVRAFKRHVLEEIPVYGDLHRFLPVLASQKGFRVSEVRLKQSKADAGTRVYRPGVYLRRLLDILTVFFLVRFTKKPLRFFGLIGVGTAAIGGIAFAWLLAERLFFGVGLADRPALLVSALFLAIGVQLVAVGLIGELIIFTHALSNKEFSIAEVVNRDKLPDDSSTEG